MNAAYLRRHTKDGERYVHRLVWEAAHGPIPDGMQVHHINENKRDNRLENLELLSIADHARVHPIPPFERCRRRYKCVNCGKAFLATQPARSCSNRCKLTLARRRRVKKPKPMRSCVICGAQVPPVTCAKTCSPEHAKAQRLVSLEVWRERAGRTRGGRPVRR